LGFCSSNDVTGIGYVLTVTFYTAGTQNAVSTVNVMFDIPSVGKNSLAIQPYPVRSAENWYKENAGTIKQTQVSAADFGIQATATFDILDGTQPGPTGEDMYWYNSVLVLQPSNSGN